MSFAREAKRRLRALIPPVILLGVAAYFAWSATQGDRGLQAYARQKDQLRLAQAELARVNAEVESWDRRVAGLRGNHIDADALDERARAKLNLADQNDMILMYGQGKKLF